MGNQNKYQTRLKKLNEYFQVLNTQGQEAEAHVSDQTLEKIRTKLYGWIEKFTRNPTLDSLVQISIYLPDYIFETSFLRSPHSIWVERYDDESHYEIVAKGIRSISKEVFQLGQKIQQVNFSYGQGQDLFSFEEDLKKQLTQLKVKAPKGYLAATYLAYLFLAGKKSAAKGSLKVADDYNYQTRGLEFQVGDVVQLIIGSGTDVGRVTESYPAIGMVQVQWPSTSYRHPVEDLQKVNPGDSPFVAPKYQTTPGGAGSAFVSEGPGPDDTSVPNLTPLVEEVRIVKNAHKLRDKVAKYFVKKSLYWNGVNRQYKCNRSEKDSSKFLCPKSNCKSLSFVLRNAIYKREDGKSVRLLACPNCLFLIRRRDIRGYEDEAPCEGEDTSMDGEIIETEKAASQEVPDKILKWMSARADKKKGKFLPALVNEAFSYLKGWKLEEVTTIKSIKGYGSTEILESLGFRDRTSGAYVSSLDSKKPLQIKPVGGTVSPEYEAFVEKFVSEAKIFSGKKPSKPYKSRQIYITKPSKKDGVFSVDQAWVGIRGWKVTSPNGKTKEIPVPISRRQFEMSGPAYDLNSFWTFVYKNGLQKSAQEFLATQDQETLDILSKPKQEREKILALKEYNAEVKKVLEQITNAQYKQVVEYWKNFYMRGYEEYMQDQQEANEAGKELSPSRWRKENKNEEERRYVLRRILEATQIPGIRGYRYEPKGGDARKLIEFAAKQKADDGRESFLEKNTIKLSAIVNRKGNFQSSEIKRLPTSQGEYEGEIEFNFEDGSSFKVRNKTIWKISSTGKPFAQFPTTFHNVKLPSGKNMSQPSEKKMVEVFATS